MSRPGDRHRTPRQYDSGAQKRKLSSDKHLRQEKEAKKSGSIADFLTRSSSSVETFGESCESEAVKADDKPSSSSQVKTDPEVTSNDDVTVTATSVDILMDPGNDDVDVNSDATAVTATSLNHEFNNDIGLWPAKCSSAMIDFWASKDTADLQNVNRGDFSKSVRNTTDKESGKIIKRSCTEQMFKRTHPNGEIVRRTWLCYSPTTGRLYCYPCRLFSTVEGPLTTCEGFDNWKNAGRDIQMHEKSSSHSDSLCSLVQRAHAVGRIDHELAEQLNKTSMYWRNVLQRVVSVITFIAERGLAFRGDNETVGSPRNGNFLGIIELLGQYDTFLAEHIQMHGNKGSGHTNYLSSTVCDELIKIMGNTVRKTIVDRIKSSKYFSVTVDSTPDNSHTDQLTCVIRYLENDCPVERFLTFLDHTGHKGNEMADALVSFLQSMDLDIGNCRGQSYDNASNMSGKYIGMQTLIRQKSPNAVFVPCSGHSLNLVGQAAVDCCRQAVSFFDFVQQVYNFFSASTSRYNLLKAKLAPKGLPMPKRLSDTRWSAHADATKALMSGYADFAVVLDEIANDANQKGETCNTASGLYDRMCKLETGFFACFWHAILDRLNSTSKKLQDDQLDLNTAVNLLKSLETFVKSLPDRFEEFESVGARNSGTTEYAQQNQRVRKANVRLNPLDYGHTPEVQLSPRERFRIDSFVPVIDMLLSALSTRVSAYKEICDRFGFLQHIDKLSTEELRTAAKNLVGIYSSDIEDTLGDELIQFLPLMALFGDDKKQGSIEQWMYTMMATKDLKSVFPNIDIMLRIYLCMMVSNCSGEKSFSKLKIIKNRLRTTLDQEKLNWLSLMSIESDVLRSIDFRYIIKDFANSKARKVSIS
jgi:hypothetical protein